MEHPFIEMKTAVSCRRRNCNPITCIDFWSSSFRVYFQCRYWSQLQVYWKYANIPCKSSFLQRLETGDIYFSKGLDVYMHCMQFNSWQVWDRLFPKYTERHTGYECQKINKQTLECPSLGHLVVLFAFRDYVAFPPNFLEEGANFLKVLSCHFMSDSS